jgi:hypothetical protein
VTRGGQPWYSPPAILTELTLRAVFRLAFRQTEGLIGSIISLLGLMLRVADHTTLSRRASLKVPQPQRQAGAQAEALHLLVDSTGLKLCGTGAWLLRSMAARPAGPGANCILASVATPVRSWPRVDHQRDRRWRTGRPVARADHRSADLVHRRWRRRSGRCLRRCCRPSRRGGGDCAATRHGGAEPNG